MQINYKKLIKILLSGICILIFFQFVVLDKIIFKKENELINNFYSDGENFVHSIKKHDSNSITNFLEKNLVSINYKDREYGATLLLWAVLEKNKELAIELIKRGANINDINPSNGLTPLHIAVSNKDAELAKFLIMKGSKLDVREKKTNLTPAEFAEKTKDAQMIEVFKHLENNRIEKPN